MINARSIFTLKVIVFLAKLPSKILDPIDQFLLKIFQFLTKKVKKWFKVDNFFIANVLSVFCLITVLTEQIYLIHLQYDGSVRIIYLVTSLL